jgi:hypothetical protein
MIKLRLLAFILLLSICCITSISAITRIVDINGTGQYTSIQAGINASASGDTVLVYPGRYLENIIIQTNNITLISIEFLTNNPVYIDSTIIDGHEANPCLRIFSSTQSILIRGFTITNGFSPGAGAGVSLFSNTQSSVVNCKILNNVSKNGAGVSISNASVYLSGVQLYNNYAYSQGGGLSVFSSNVTFDVINRCSIYNNKAGAGQDIYVGLMQCDLYVYLNTFSVLNPTSYYATAYTGTGISYNVYFDILSAHHQEINNHLFVSPYGDDNNDGLTSQTPLKTIHTAIYRITADSLNPKSVHILPGTYSRTDNQQILPISLKSWVKVEGSNEQNTLIVSEPHPRFPNVLTAMFRAFNEHHFSLSTMSLTSINSTDDIVVWGENWNYAKLTDLQIYNVHPDSYPVIYCGKSYNSILEKLVIENISTQGRGLVNGSFHGTFKDCIFTNSSSTYYDNVAWANPLIGITINQELTFENCIFDNVSMSDDDTPAIQISGMSDSIYQNRLNLINCRFTDFTCQSDIMVISSANNPIININNCTFAGSAGNASMLYINGIVNVANSIFYNDTLSEIRLYNYTGFQNNLTVDYSCLRRGQTGISPSWGSIVNYLPTNISSEPVFVGDNSGYLYKYYLSDVSPCINAGTPDTTGLALPELDILGNPRLFGGRIDMGAYEWNGTCNNDDYTPQAIFNDVRIYPNPFRDKTTILYSIVKNSDVKINIYNVKGQIVKSLLSNKSNTGKHALIWDGTDENGNLVASGMYIIKTDANAHRITKKVLVVK